MDPHSFTMSFDWYKRTFQISHDLRSESEYDQRSIRTLRIDEGRLVSFPRYSLEVLVSDLFCGRFGLFRIGEVRRDDPQLTKLISIEPAVGHVPDEDIDGAIPVPILEVLWSNRWFRIGDQSIDA